MSEPARTPDSGNGSRSTSRICEPQDLCSRRSSFSISTCTQIPPARIAHNTHPHRTSSLAPEVTSPVADFAQFQEYNRLAPPKTPPRKPHHKHSQSLQPGLLSPVSSFASFKAVFNPPRVPSPLSLSPSPLARSPRTRPTPLRLLRPFTSIVSPATPTPTLATAVASASVPRSSLLFATDSDEQPAMYHPKPQHPPSPSTSGSSNHLVRPTTPHRPPSRSEKLLREALMKDEHDRNPMPYTASPYPSGHPATSPVRSHQRRHSHVPSAREDGTFLVQRPVFNGLRSPSPSPAPDYHSSLSRRHSQGHGHHPQDQLHASSPYSLAQSPTSASPTRDRQARGHSPLARRSSVKSQSHQARPASPASHSRGYTHSHQSPSYTPSVTSSHYAPGSPSLSRRHVPRPLPLSPAPEAAHFQLPNEPLTMTPHEQVLRARLERVLQANANVNGRDGDLPRGGAEWMIGQAVDVDESTDSDENVVRDENGGRAWRKKHGAVLTPPSSGSNSARSLSKEDMLLKQTSALHHQHHQRSRSRTEPAPFTPSAAAAAGIASPKRSSTGPAPQSPYMSAKAQYHHQHRHQQHTHGGRSGTTPPLVSDSSPATPEEEEDPEDLRLLTPPPTPPSQAAYHHYSIGKEYMPSPYKTSFSLKRGGGAPPPLGLLRDDESRGRSGYIDSASEDEDEDEYDEEEELCSCCSGSGSCSRVSMPHHQQMNPQMYGNLGMAPGMSAGYPSARRPQFNARRASAKCRQMDGYVSFSAVEGLGAPPEVDSEEEERKKREEILRKRDGGGVTDWVRWTKRRLLGGSEDHRQSSVPPAHSVVL